MKCIACNKPVIESEILKCRLCKGSYHYQCLNMATDHYQENLTDLQRGWKCESCSNINKKPKSDDTPVKVSHEIRPNSSSESGDVTKDASASTGTARAAARTAATAGSGTSTTPRVGLVGPPPAGPVTIEQIAELLDSKFDEKMTSKLLDIQSSLTRDFKRELHKYFNDIKADFDKSLDFLSGQLSDVKKEVAGLESRLSKLECENSTLKTEISTLKSQANTSSDAAALKTTILQLNTELNERDQAMLINDVEITGVPEFPGESVVSIVAGAAAKLGVQLETRDIVYAAREDAPRSASGVAATNGPAAASGPQAATGLRPRRIVVRLARQALRDDLLRAARVRRDVNTADLGLPHHVPVRMYVNERLTRLNRVLLGKAREAKRELGWRFVWTREGRIYARRDDTPASRTQRLRNEEDLSRVFGSGVVGQKA